MTAPAPTTFTAFGHAVLLRPIGASYWSTVVDGHLVAVFGSKQSARKAGKEKAAQLREVERDRERQAKDLARVAAATQRREESKRAREEKRLTAHLAQLAAAELRRAEHIRGATPCETGCTCRRHRPATTAAATAGGNA